MREWIIQVGLFLAVFASLFTSRNMVSSDSAWSIYTAMSIIKEGNTDLDEYRDIIARSYNAYAAETVDAHLYNVYPLGASILAMPVVFVLDKLSPEFAETIKYVPPNTVELFVASLFMALTTVIIYRMSRLYLNWHWSLGLAFVFVFCTPVWSSVSRSLSQHVPSLLTLTCALYLILLARERPHLIQFAGLLLAFSYVARPTNSVAIILLTIYVFVQYRRYFLRYLLWALLVAVPFVAVNFSVYHAPLSHYYYSYRGFALSGTFLEALLGNLISPSRGLLIFSPVLVFALVGLMSKIKQRQFETLDAFLLGIVLIHWGLISLWPIWWAGWSFGPRMFAEILPFLIFWMIYAVAALAHSTGYRRYVSICAWSVLIAWSFFVNYLGSNVAESQTSWNLYPADVDRHPERVWDWRDIQFLRGFKWGTPTDFSVAGIDPRRMGPEVYISLGTNDVRVRMFNAAQALIAPPARSWFAISSREPIAPELAPLFGDIRPPILQRTMADQQPFRLYFFDAGARILKAAAEAEHTAFESQTVFPDLHETRPMTLPVKFGESAELLGYQLSKSSKPSGSETLITYWRAGEHVVKPLQMFVHAIGPKGTIAAQSDRLDTSAYDWQPDDLIAQVHQLVLPAQTEQLWLEIGLYKLDTGERLPVSADDQVLGDRLLLQEIQP